MPQACEVPPVAWVPSELRFSFNGSVAVEGRANRLTNSTGVLALREVDKRLGFTEWLVSHLQDPRRQELITHPFVELLRTRLYLVAQGSADQDDADRCRHDPALRIAVSKRRGLSPLECPDKPGEPDGLSSQPTQSRLISTLCLPPNLSLLEFAPLELARRDLRATGNLPLASATIDLDSLPIIVHGTQPGSEYNGYYHAQCYHPLAAMLGETGHFLAGRLRPGNVPSADGAVEFAHRVLDEVEEKIAPVAAIRGDAAFPEEGLLKTLEDRCVDYVFRLKNNARLRHLAEPLVRRPVGRPPKEPRLWFHELQYQAKTWSRERRVVLVIKEVPGEIFLDYFFLVTSWYAMEMPGEDLLEFYRQRGTMEGHLGELKSVFAPALSCTPRPKSHLRNRTPKKRYASRDAERGNAVTFLLHLLAYDLTHALRRIISREKPGDHGEAWSLGRLREQILAIPARVVIHAHRALFVVNESAAFLWALLWKGLAALTSHADSS